MFPDDIDLTVNVTIVCPRPKPVIRKGGFPSAELALGWAVWHRARLLASTAE